jgi:hypothetical protein
MIATFNGFVIKLKKTNRIVDGFPIYSYHAAYSEEPELVFFDNHFKPSIAAFRNPDLLPLELLQWITLYYWDNDEDLFEGYTPEQLEFAQSAVCHTIGYIVDDAYEMIDLGRANTVTITPNCKAIHIEDIEYPLVIITEYHDN